MIAAVPLSAASLRQDLSARAVRLGRRYELTTGRSPSVVFGPEVTPDHQVLHGNFHPASYQAILDQPTWARRLGKAHTGYLRALPRADWHWRELDCATSSDALLMNVFCHPQIFDDGRVAAMLGVDRTACPDFGVKPRVPLANNRVDATEVDMQLGSLLVEAKLTESNFQTARPALVERFRDLESVFDVERLPRTRTTLIDKQWDEERAAFVPVERGSGGHFASYQLIRGSLAAHAGGAGFCVLTDGRRTDLIEAWHRVLQAVRTADLRCRLQVLTWQELAAVLPPELQRFLDTKYGILTA